MYLINYDLHSLLSPRFNVHLRDRIRDAEFWIAITVINTQATILNWNLFRRYVSVFTIEACNFRLIKPKSRNAKIHKLAKLIEKLSTNLKRVSTDFAGPAKTNLLLVL